MSRVGRRPIDIPGDVKLTVEGNKVKVEAKGKSLEHADIIASGILFLGAVREIEHQKSEDEASKETSILDK